MATVSRTVETNFDRDAARRLVDHRAMPFTLTLTDGKRRSTEQNNLQRKWMVEIAEQLGDRTPEDARGECKLEIGVPILRAENEAFRVAYDTHVRHLPYETKLALMKEPLDFPITRLMTTKQKTDYLDAISRKYSEQGVVLTNPEWR